MENRFDQVNDMKDMLEQLENKLSELASDSRALAMMMKKYGGSVGQQGYQLEGYLTNRLKSFLECSEMFRFDYAREVLEDELLPVEDYDEEAL